MFNTQDLERLRDFIDAYSSSLNLSTNKDVVLVLGNNEFNIAEYLVTNYMQLGGNTKRSKPESDLLLKSKNLLPPHNFPGIATLSRCEAKNITFCNYPGFLEETGAPLEKLCEAISFELAIQAAAKIQGIFVVIDQDQFYTARAAHFRFFIQRLIALFNPHFQQTHPSLSLLVTRKPTDQSCVSIKAELLHLMQQMIREMAEISKLSVEQILVKNFLEFITTHSNQFIVVDRFDQVATRYEICTLLASFSPLKKDNFNFNYQDSRLQLEKLFELKLEDGIEALKLYNLCRQNLNSLQSKSENETTKQKRTEQLAQKDKRLGNELSLINRELSKLQEDLINIESEKQKTGQALDEIEKQLTAIDNDTPVRHWHEPFTEERSAWFGALSWTRKTFQYTGIPFIEVKCEPGNSFEDQHSDPAGGTYSSTYKSDFGVPGNAAVTIYVRSKDLPANVPRIKALNKQQEQQQQRKKSYSAEATILSEKISQEKQQATDIRQSLAQLHNENEAITTKQIEIQKQISALEESKLQSEIAIEKKLALLKIIQDILQRIMPDFLKMQTFLKLLEQYETLLTLTPLHIAILQKNRSLIKKYSRQTSALNAQNIRGETALQLAIRHAYMQGVLILVCAGASLFPNQSNLLPFDQMLQLHSEEKDFTEEEKQVLALMFYQEGTKLHKSFIERNFSLPFQEELGILYLSFQKNNLLFQQQPDRIVAQCISDDRFNRSIEKRTLRHLFNLPELKVLLDIFIFTLGYSIYIKKNKSAINPLTPLSVVIDPEKSRHSGKHGHGIYYDCNHTIYVSGHRATADRTEKNTEVQGAWARAISSFVTNEVFKNNCKPYRANDQNRAEQFQVICEDIYSERAHVHPVLSEVFAHEKETWHAELISRVAQLIVLTQFYTDAAQKTSALLTYYQTFFLPACTEYLENLLDSNTMNRSLLSQEKLPQEVAETVLKQPFFVRVDEKYLSLKPPHP